MMMDDNAIAKLFLPLYSDIRKEEEFYVVKPLLAHYTSLEALERILQNNEVWFSNPLFMNDLDEVKFGVLNGAASIKSNESVRNVLKTAARHRIFTEAIDFCISHFEDNHLLDTYVFCLSEHDHQNSDGILSMWRGYGGNGRGAALVFDTSKLSPVEGSPFVLARVHYGSSEARFQWFEQLGATFAGILAENDIPDDKLFVASHAVLRRITLGSLFMKHDGFKEEREWRVVHMADQAPAEKLKVMQHYLNGPRGVEPKLRFKFEPMEGITPPDFSLEHILERILLGPSTSSGLAVRSVQRMLDLIGRSELKTKLVASSIPFRATSSVAA